MYEAWMHQMLRPRQREFCQPPDDTRPSPSLLDDGKSYTLSQDIAQTLNLHFSTVGVKLTSKFNSDLSLFEISPILLILCKRKQD